MADNITLKDGLGNLIVMRTTNTAGINTTHTVIDQMPPLAASTVNIGRVTPQIGDEDVSLTNPIPVSVPDGVDIISLPELPQGGNHIGHVSIQHGGFDVSTSNPFPVSIQGAGVTLNVSGALPTGSNTIGKVIIDALPVLPAGSNVIGKVVQQLGGSDISNSNPLPITVAGGTLGVNVASALPAGTNNIGFVNIQAMPALPSGTSHIGKITPQIDGVDVSASNPIPVSISGTTITANISGSLAAGTNNIGKVTLQVSGTDVAGGNPMPVTLANGSITSLPALATGSNVIGRVGLQVASVDVGDVNPVPVKITAPIAAGTNVIGKVAHQVAGADLSDGNPMPVSIVAADMTLEFSEGLPEGENTLGRVILEANGVDVTTAAPLPVTLVSSAALPAGSNNVGKVTLQADATDVSNAAPLPVRGQRGSLTDASGTVATGGLSQSVLAQQNSRRFLLVQNLSSDDLYLNFGTAASPSAQSIKIAPDGAFSMDSNFIATDEVFLYGPTTGQQYVIKWA